MPDLATPLERFELGAEIARGGMGRVVEARDRVLGRTVAIKQVIDPEHDPAGVVRFERETAITARLEHPAIVPLYDAGRDADGLPYYVMRKVDGQRLSELVERAGSLDARLALLPNVLAACDAVAHAHSRGVIHRDLKPANILVGDFGETVVIDWGLAKVQGEPDDTAPGVPASVNAGLDTVAGVVMGTPGYMAPEQLRGELVTARTDVYALGATLGHVLAGRRPEEIIPEVPGVPDDLRTILRTAIESEPSRRFADAGQLASELRRFLAGQLVATHRYSWGARLVRFVRRHRVAVAVATGAMVAIAVVAAVAFERVVAARDAALEQAAAAELARRRETDRADELLVERARLLAPKNPLGAITQLHRLRADSPSWRRAHGVAAEAATHGVPWAIPGGHTPQAVAITRDATRAYTSTREGEIWVHDLEARSSTLLRQGVPGAHVALLAGDRQLVIGGEREVIVRELSTGAELVTPIGSPITRLVSGGLAVGWIDKRSHAFVIRAPGAEVVELPRSPVTRLALSPDGAQVAVIGLDSTTLHDVDAPAVVQHQHTGQGWDVRWSADGTTLAIADLVGGYALTRRPDRTFVEVQLVKRTTRAALFAGGAPVFASSDNFVYRPGNTTERRASGAVFFGHADVVEDGAVFDTANRELVVVGPVTERVLRLPAAPLALAAARRRAVVAVQDRVLIYDLAPILPRTIATPASRLDHRVLIGERQLLAASLDEVTVTWTLHDLETGAVEPYGTSGFPSDGVRTAEDGSYVVIRDMATGVYRLLRPGGARHDFPPSVTRVIACSPELLVAIEGRQVRRIEVPSGTTTTLGELEGGTRFAASRTHVAIATATALVRFELATGRRTELALAAPLSALRLIGSTAYLGQDRQVSAWDGERLTPVATLAEPIEQLAVAANQPVAIGARGGVWTVVGGVRRLLPPRSDAAMWSLDGTRAVSRSIDHELLFHDLETGDRRELPLQAEGVMLAPSGKRLVVPYANGVAVYDLPIPSDAASYQRELVRLTNLRADDADEVIWP